MEITPVSFREVGLPQPPTTVPPHQKKMPHSTRLRMELKDKVPSEWFRGRNLYGWTMTVKVLGPLFLALWAAPILFVKLSWFSLFLLVPVVGTLLYKIQFLLHDCSHRSLFRSPQWNERVGTFCGWLTGANFEVYRFLHWSHHRFNGELKDPQFYDYLVDRPIDSRTYAWFLLSPLIGARIAGFVKRELGSLFHRKTKKSNAANPAEGFPPIGMDWVLAVVIAQLGIATLITGGWKYPLLALVYPAGAAIIALFLARVRTIAEHHHPYDPTLDPDFTRSHRPAFWDAVFLYEAHFNYHLEHHIFPQMPSCHLGRFQKQFGKSFHSPESLGASMLQSVWNFFKALK